MNTFLIYIVKDPLYYNVENEKVGTTMGDLAFTAELFIIPAHLLFGALMDSVGRKYPTSIGLIMAGICITLMPRPNAEVFPGLYILR